MQRSSWLWPFILVCWTILAAISLFVVPTNPLRPVVMLGFLTICPGMALVRHLRLSNAVSELTIAVALSIAIDAIVAALFLYAGHWVPNAIFIVLMEITIVCILLQLVLDLLRYHRSLEVR